MRRQILPRHRTPHHTDGPGIGKKLAGDALAKHLNKLAETVTAEHRQAEEKWRGWINHARAAGEALIEAKRRLGHRTKWSEWRKRHFTIDGVTTLSKETSCNYMRIAREWEDPRLREARANGIKLDSINKVLSILRGDSLKKEPAPEKEQEAESRVPDEGSVRQWLREQFAADLRSLTKEELQVFEVMYAEFWERLYADLRDDVCVMLECDYYGEEEELKEVVRRRINRALNRKRNGKAATGAE